MKTISIINLKGGVAKTLTADSMAHVLATLHNKRVLLVDNDKQGNTSKAFGVHSYDDKSISDVLTARRLDPREVIKKTRFENIDVMPANMTLIRANMEVLMDSTRPQQTAPAVRPERDLRKKTFMISASSTTPRTSTFQR